MAGCDSGPGPLAETPATPQPSTFLAREPRSTRYRDRFYYFVRKNGHDASPSGANDQARIKPKAVHSCNRRL